MKRFWMLFVLVICTVSSSCFEKHGMYVPENDDSLRFLSFTDYHCQDESEGLAKNLSSRVYIVNHFMNGDTLTLRIHYEANCCPAFVNETTVSQGNIVIAIADTLRNAKCMCDYENDYKFLYSYKGDLRVIFKWWDINHENLTTYMDTTIVIN